MGAGGGSDGCSSIADSVISGGLWILSSAMIHLGLKDVVTSSLVALSVV